VDLEGRARRLARRFELPQPTTVVWAEQRSRWGSCTPSTGELRLSNRLAAWPPWVLDYVIVHELAHLVEFDHSPAFHALVDRYPLAERARGFLIAKSQGEEDTADTADTPETGGLPSSEDVPDGELFAERLFTDEGSAGSVG
jgi:predicted metal-dependent hydrolase